MHFIGIDVHKKQSQICVLSEAGEVTYEIRIPTDRPNLSDILRRYAGARVLMEASTESEWVARHLESLELKVIVADPNFAPMYATRSKKIKTDKRDALPGAGVQARGVPAGPPAQQRAPRPSGAA